MSQGCFLHNPLILKEIINRIREEENHNKLENIVGISLRERCVFETYLLGRGILFMA